LSSYQIVADYSNTEVNGVVLSGVARGDPAENADLN
jgi:hypothetical protein